MNKAIQVIYDDERNTYCLPAFIINKPIEYQVKQELITNFEKDDVDIKVIHATKLKTININNSKTVKELIDICIKEYNLDTNKVIKIIQSGKIWEDNKLIGNYLNLKYPVQIVQTNII